MLAFNSKIIKICAIILLIYCVYQYKKEKGEGFDRIQSQDLELQNKTKPQYTISINKKKPQDKYNVLEKLLYNLYLADK